MAPRSVLIALLLTVFLAPPAYGQGTMSLNAGPTTLQAQYDPRWGGYDPRWRADERQQAYERQQRARAPRWRDHEPNWRGFDHFWEAPPEPRRQAPAPRRSGPELLTGGPRPNITPVAPEIVAFPNNEPAGTVIIDHEARKLYYTLSQTQAYEYPVAVGREGFDWTGTEKISRIASWPDWHPPAEMRQRQPELPKMMTGGLRNPLGAKALYLGDSLYRIHGSNDASTIGQAASSGCFRMNNEHVVHLARLVEVGTTVKVVKRWSGGNMSTVSGTSESGSPAVSRRSDVH